MNRGRLAGIIAKHAEHAQPHASGSADWRAHVERVERTQLIEIPLDEICELEENLLPLVRLEFAPRAFERLAGGCHCAVDIFGIAFRDRGQQLAGRRIAAFEVLAGSSVDPFAVDQHLFEGAVREGVTRHRNSFGLGHFQLRCAGYVQHHIAMGGAAQCEGSVTRSFAAGDGAPCRSNRNRPIGHRESRPRRVLEQGLPELTGRCELLRYGQPACARRKLSPQPDRCSAIASERWLDIRD